MGIEPLETVDPKQLYGIVAELQRVADRLVQEKLEPVAPTPPMSATWVRSLIRLRKLRRDYLGAEIFFDPAWDMLLELYAARLEERRVTVTNLCMAAAVAPTTALRWMQGLESKGLITRHPDPVDGRRIYMELSEDAALKMDSILAAAQMQSVVLL